MEEALRNLREALEFYFEDQPSWTTSRRRHRTS
jgi:predicted RNase H-like HicB family nuclease